MSYFSKNAGWAGTVLAGLVACSPVYYNVAGVKEAQASEVVNCTLIGRVVLISIALM